MANGVSSVSFAAPTDYSAQLADIERRRKIAQALQEQAAQPIGGTEMAGGWAIQKSPMEGIGKLAQALSGAYQQKQLNEEQKKIGDQQRLEEQQANERLAAASQGVRSFAENPIQTASLPTWATDAMPDLQQQPASAEDRRQMMLSAALAHPNPAIRSAAVSAMMAPLAKGNEMQTGIHYDQNGRAFTLDKSGQPHFISGITARDKIVSDNLGGQNVYRTEYSATPVSTVNRTVSPDTKARIENTDYWNNNLSANQYLQAGLENRRLANQAVETNFNTTGGASSGPLFTGLPQQPMQFTQTAGGGAPQSTAEPIVPPSRAPVATGARQPQPAATQSADGVTPKAKAEIAAANLQAVTGARKILDAAGYDANTGKDEVSDLIDKSTSGMMQNAAANTIGFFGKATSGREAIGRLETLSTKLVMDLMGGKLGTGISNADRDFVVAQLGNVSNANVPANERKAAWQQAMRRLVAITGGKAAPAPAEGAVNRIPGQGGSNGRIVVEY